MPMTKNPFSVLPFLLSGLTAQTFVVDTNNGPGTNFTTLGTAIAAVPDGSTLIVRAGAYVEPLHISGRSLTIVGELGAQVWAPPGPGGLRIDNLAVGQTVTIARLMVQFNAFGTAEMEVANNQGLVVLDHLGTQAVGLDLRASQNARLVVRGTTFDGLHSELVSTAAVFEQCAVRSNDPTSLVIDGGDVQFVDSYAIGASSTVTAGVAVELRNGAALRALGSSVIRGGYGFFTGHGFAIAGIGSVRLDPAVIVGDAQPPIAATVVATTSPMPCLSRTEGSLGSTIQTELRGPIGHLGIVGVGFAAPRAFAPPIVDAGWWDPNLVFTQAIGVPATGSPVVAATVLPNAPALRGIVLVQHGLTWDPTVGLQLSNPAHLPVL